MLTSGMTLCIIIPTLGEGSALLTTLQALQSLRAGGVELVVVDGESADTALTQAAILADQVLSAPRGRASQMNAGACATRADALLFLHADTQLPPDADGLIAQALQHSAWGRFDVRIDGASSLLRLVERMMNWRSRITGVATGDQALFVRRSVFERVGGFAPLALMEDIELCGRLKAMGAPVCLRQHVVTSARRWQQHGVLRTVLLMWQLRAAYFFSRWSGVSTHALALRYGYTPRAPAAVAVLAKAPIPGLAKTRLIPLLGAARAARAQRGFSLRTLATARAACTGSVVLWCAPDTSHHFFKALQLRHGVQCVAQPTGHLGQRMQAAVEAHFAHNRQMPLLIVGTDCPALSPVHLQQAADALQQHDAVLIPAEDGGYVLLGMRRPVPEVFVGVDWSTPLVLAQTRERLRQANASWYELPALWDVDEPADWKRLLAAELQPPGTV
jgi:rSAM/selenodomain-associated transferase 2/rSAM/selenodomain-associated transferase 1